MITDNASVDVLFQGNAYGNVASVLKANGMKPSALRTLETMSKESWLRFDHVVQTEALRRLTVAEDMIAAGMTYDLRSVGMGKTVLQWSTTSEMTEAEITMDGIKRASSDQLIVNFANLLPLYIIHKDINFSLREMEEAANGDVPLDTTNLAAAAEKISETIEDVTVNGPTVVEGGVVRLPTAWGNASAYGFTTAPNRGTGHLGGQWSDTGYSPQSIKNDVMAMMAAQVVQRQYGPYMLYVPVGYEQRLNDDYTYSGQTSVSATITVRDRIKKFDKIVDVRVADFLAADNVLCVNWTPKTADLVICVDPMVIPWQSEGGMQQNFKILTIMVPRFKYTQALRSGIQHYTYP